MRDYSVEQYNAAINLKQQGLGSLRISKVLDIPRSSIESWINRNIKPYHISEKRKKALNSQENINRLKTMSKLSQPKACKMAAEINKKRLPRSAYNISEDLGYILGVINGDGCVSTKQRRVILSVIDKDFAIRFKDTLERWSKLNARLYSRDIKTDKNIINRKTQWVTYLDSIEASKFLSEFNIEYIYIAPKEIKCNFLRGLFDSEGSVGKDSVIFYNTNKKLVDITKELLQSLNINTKLNIYKVKSLSGKEIKYYRLVIYSANKTKFYNEIGFSIGRKQNKLMLLINNKRKELR